MTTRLPLVRPALLVAVLLSALGAQPLTVERLTVDHGLSSNYLWRLAQDRQGFLWIATRDGLCRYDGYDVTVFRSGGPGSVSHNDIWAVFEDRSGRLWTGTYGGGLNRFDRATQTFTNFRNDPDDPTTVSDNHIRAFHEFPDEPGVLWIATYGGGLNRLDTRSGTFQAFRHDPAMAGSLPHDRLWAIDGDAAGNLWIGTFKGLAVLDRATRRAITAGTAAAAVHFTCYQNRTGDPTSISVGEITGLTIRRNGRVWVGTADNGLNRFDPKTGVFERFNHDPADPASLSHDAVRPIFEDSRGQLWIGTYGGGLNRFNPENNSFDHYTHNPSDPLSLSNNIIRDIFEDDAGTIWVATYGGGLNKFREGAFVHYRHEPENDNSLISNFVTAVHEDRAGQVWVGTVDRGITRIHWDGGRGGHYSHFAHDPARRNSLSGNHVKTIMESRHTPGVLWITTFGTGLNRLNNRTGVITHFRIEPDHPQAPRFNSMTSLWESRSEPGILWVGTDGNGLHRFDTRTGTFTYVPHNGMAFGDPNHESVEGLHESPLDPGAIWFGVDSEGLYRLVPVPAGTTTPPPLAADAPLPAGGGMVSRYLDIPGAGRWRLDHFRHVPGDSTSLPGTIRFFTHHSPRSGLWVGSANGLSRMRPRSGAAGHPSTGTDFDPSAFAFQTFTTGDGLPGLEIAGLLEDSDGNLWLGTNNGLSRFHPDSGTFVNFGVDDGLQGRQFTFDAAYRSRDGRMFFGGINGLNEFHPDSIRANTHVPPVVITDFQLFNASVPIDADGRTDGVALPAHISEMDHITLAHHQSVFSLQFAALDFVAPRNNRYAYRMEGFDAEWTDSGNRRFATYTNLDPGDYVFRVRGANSDGVWNMEGATLRITITPPWWRTWWAYGSYLLLLVGAVFAIDRAQRRRLRREERERATLREMELRAEVENERRQNVEMLSEIGKEITASLDFDTIVHRLYDHINTLMDATVFGIGIYHAERHELEYRFAIERGHRYEPYSRDTRDPNQLPVWCIQHRQPVFINDIGTESRAYIASYQHLRKSLADGSHSRDPQSLMYLPLISKDEVLGVITIQSLRRNAYTEYHLSLLQNLAAYTSVALENARLFDETRRARAAAEEANRAKSDFLSNVSHELRTPLTSVLGFARIIQKRLQGKVFPAVLKADGRLRKTVTQISENLDIVVMEGERLTALINNVLDLAKIEAGRVEWHIEPLTVSEILERAAAATASLFKGTALSFDTRINGPLPQINGDRDKLIQVMINLISNAVKFTETGGVTCTAERERDAILIRVTDTGIGIGPEDQEAVFEQFKQVGNTMTDKPLGTGLGLAICREIVEYHGGRIWVESEIDKGSTFFFTLPVNGAPGSETA